MKRTLKISTLLLVPFIAWGCDALFYDLDEPSFVSGGDMTNQQDMTTQRDMTTTSDMTMAVTDMADMPTADMSMDVGTDMADMAVDMGPPENVCLIGGTLVGVCDPVAQNCSQGTCDLFLNVNLSRLESACATQPDTYILPLGSACDGPSGTEKCLAGLNCLAGNICRKNCDRITGAGCDSGEFCRTFEPTLSMGYCAPDCP